MNPKMPASFPRNVVAVASLLLPGFSAIAQQPSLNYSGSAGANDGGGGYANSLFQGTDVNPYTSPLSDGSAVRYDLFVGSEDKGIFSMASSSIAVNKDDITLIARAESDVTSDAVIYQPNAEGVVNFATYKIPLTYHTESPFQSWNCTVNFVDPAVTLHSNLGAGAQTDFHVGFDNGAHIYETFESRYDGGDLSVQHFGPQVTSQNGTGDETIDFYEEVGVAAVVNYNPGNGTASEAIIDPGLPILFSDLSPGLTISGPDGHIYASSVPSAVPEPSLSAYWVVLGCAASLSLYWRQAKRRHSSGSGILRHSVFLSTPPTDHR